MSGQQSSPTSASSFAAGGRLAEGGGLSESSDPLQATFSGIMQAMQRFEALKPRLGQLPQHTFDTVAREAQGLHERFLALQRRGMQMAGDGNNQPSGSAMSSYIADLQTFYGEQKAFVDRMEQVLPGSGPGGLQPAQAPQAATSAGFGLPPAGLPAAGLGGAGGARGVAGVGGIGGGVGGIGGAVGVSENRPFAWLQGSAGAQQPSSSTSSAALAQAIGADGSSGGLMLSRSQLESFATLTLNTRVLPDS